MKRLSTELNDRELRFDGISIIDPTELARVLVRGVQPSQVRVTAETDEVRLFNDQVTEDQKIRLNEPEPVTLPMGWSLPPEYLNLDLQDRVISDFGSKCLGRLKLYTEEQLLEATERIAAELQEIERRGMQEFMRTIIYVLDTFRKQNIVWGVGRGSSCACYILYIIGLHTVDCVRHQIPMNEFFHD